MLLSKRHYARNLYQRSGSSYTRLNARCCERDEKLPDLASSLRRLISRAYPEAVPDLQDSLAKDQFIDALEDREIRMKLRESGLKTLSEVSRKIKAMQHHLTDRSSQQIA